MRFLKRASPRARHADDIPVDDEESDRGGYLIRAEAGAPAMLLTEPIPSMRSEEFPVSAPSPQALKPGAHCLLGGPGEPTCEVVQVSVAVPRRIRRGMFGTIASPHPAGTVVTLVSAEHIGDWSRWRGEDGAGQADA
ncbi:hypothetical protein HEP85_31700 [Streptomyces sp. RPA4-2]|uniref:hypothetical protein n=1 Tax=Streptomyces sp. RPA4-2 TaxID=2721244 RepID=UPI00143E13A2|nr:hypothetical protein [Streptomyces sp. RPA4-2]QIY65331.1 hypothetical protein HEP85_31700 [Streptomyces sp. RPA4-2]